MHSTVSDGTDTPEALLARVRDAGIRIFSLTDHDSIKGCARVRAAWSEGDPRFIEGTELSCRDGKGRYHILGYGYDPQGASIRAITDKSHALRMEKLQGRLDFIASEFGFTFSDEDLTELRAMDNPGKPHIGNLMVRYGYAKDRAQAISEFINKKKFKSNWIDPADAIRAVLESGGIPVLAHPSYGNGNQMILGDEMDERLRHLVAYGLCGVEAYYSGFPAKLTDQLLAFAEKYDLCVTAGSDYHGTNKLVPLGDTGEPFSKAGEARISSFLEMLGKDCAR